MDYTDAIRHFLEYADVIKGYSQSTLDGYRRMLRRFGADMGISTLNQLTLPAIDGYMALLVERGRTKDGIYNEIVAIRSFIRFLNRKQAIGWSYELIDVPRREIRPVDALTIEEVQAIIDNMDRERDRLMALILFTSGIRVNELVNLKAEDVEGVKLRVVGKGNKPRLVFIHEYVAQRLYIYMTMEIRTEGYIFTGQGGRGHLDAVAVRRAIRAAADRAGITKRVYPHLFRHTFATMMMRSGMDVRTVQTLLGHDQIQTTMRYLQVTDNWKQEQYDKHKPHITLSYEQAKLPKSVF